MPFDGITLYGVMHELKDCLTGNRINKIYQTSKNEIIFFIRHNRKDYKLLLSADSVNCRLHLIKEPRKNPSSPPMFCMLLRKYLTGGKIESISQKGLERIVEIIIHNTDEFMQPAEYKLIIEIMGKHSNIILLDLKSGTIIDSIKRISSKVNRYREVLPGIPYINPPVQNKIDLLSIDTNTISSTIKEASHSKSKKTLSKWILDNFAGFSGISAQEIALRAKIDHKTPICTLSDDNINKLTTIFTEFKNNLVQQHFNPKIYLDHKTKEPIDFWAFPMLSHKNKHMISDTGINCIVDLFFVKKNEVSIINSNKHRIRTQVSQNIRKLTQNLYYLKKQLNKTKDLQKYKLWGDTLLTYIYKIKPGQSKVRLPDIYGSKEEVLIPLNEKLSPSHNAQVYFNRYKKLQSTKNIVQKRISNTQMEIDYLESTLINIENSQTLEDISEIQQELMSQNYINKAKRSLPKECKTEPLKFKSSHGSIIYVGKNNKQNDTLTFKKSNPDDIWLHVKDIPGSHVIINSQDQNISETTLLEAAALAGYFSKARNSSNVPVDYTFVKNVKKPTGAKPGFVTYYHQKTIYVTPNENIIKKLSF